MTLPNQPTGVRTSLTISPQDDARLPILAAQIEREWEKWRPLFLKELREAGDDTDVIRQTALHCVRVLHAYEEQGLGADMAQEVVREIIIPQPER